MLRNAGRATRPPARARGPSFETRASALRRMRAELVACAQAEHGACARPPTPGAALFRRRRRFDAPIRVGAEGVIDEERPGSIRKLAMHLHAMVVHFDRTALAVAALDQPLRPGHAVVAVAG